MKPAWDQLIEEYAGSASALIADVDCTAEGKDLCETHGVQGFPSIKWGDPSALQDYEGGRDFEELKSFAEENLTPLCSPTNLDLCDEEKKADINKLQAMSPEDLKAQIEMKEGELKDSEETFDEEVKKLQETYEQLEKDKEAKQKAIKASGLGLMKAVVAAKEAKGEKEEL